MPEKPWQRDLGEYYKMVPSGKDPGTFVIEDDSSVLLSGLERERAEEIVDLLHSVRSTWWGEGYLERELKERPGGRIAEAMEAAGFTGNKYGQYPGTLGPARPYLAIDPAVPVKPSGPSQGSRYKTEDAMGCGPAFWSPPKPRRCLFPWSHEWGRWGMVLPLGSYAVQRRACRHCGKVQERVT